MWWSVVRRFGGRQKGPGASSVELWDDLAWRSYTPLALRALELAADEARRLGHAKVGTAHVLLGLLGLRRSVAYVVLGEILGLDPGPLRETLARNAEPDVPAPTPHGLGISPPLRRVFQLAADEARTLGYEYVGTEHLLLALLREEEGLLVRSLQAAEIAPAEVRAELLKVLSPGSMPPATEPPPATNGEDREP